MSGFRPHTARAGGLIAAAALAATAVSAAPATAVSGPRADVATAAALARLGIGTRSTASAAAPPHWWHRSGC
ncbi:hypothetical protein [Streptomyces sp. NPDC093018]|uniref:hypothetical protein n=1 Tax=Streptomyces sp. NPDC093018 TaxID=3155067 RepID=UPI0034404B97